VVRAGFNADYGGFDAAFESTTAVRRARFGRRNIRFIPQNRHNFTSFLDAVFDKNPNGLCPAGAGVVTFLGGQSVAIRSQQPRPLKPLTPAGTGLVQDGTDETDFSLHCTCLARHFDDWL
jgi:hypothetical protein